MFELSKVGLEHIRRRVLANLRNVDDDLAARVAAGLGAQLPEASPAAAPVIDFEPSPALSIIAKARPTLQGRTVGILFADGSDAEEIERVVASVVAAGATPLLIAPRLLGVATTPKPMNADGQLAGTPSVVCDAVALVLDDTAAAALCHDAAAVQFVADAYAHLKAIGHTDAAKVLLDRAGAAPDDGVVGLGDEFIQAAGRRHYDREARVRRLA